MASPTAVRGLKIVGITIGALVALIILFLLAVWLFVNPNDYKGRIEQSVQQSTGRTLALPGDIKLSVFPSISLELGPASLGNPPGFGPEPFASLQHVSLQVRLLPLLHKQLQIGHVQVDGLDLRLMTNAQGQGNWQMSTSATPAAPPSGASASSGESELPQVAGIVIRRSRLSYQNEVADGVNLTVGRIAPGATVPVDFKLELKRTPSAPPIALSGHFALTLGTEAYRLSDLKAQLDGSTLSGEASLGRSASTPISFDLALNQIDLDRYLGTGQAAAPPKAATAASAAGAPTELPTDRLKGLQLQGNLTIGSARLEGIAVSQVHVGLSAHEGLLRISPAAATLYGGSSTGTITLDARGALPSVTLEQNVSGVNMQPLLNDLMHTQRLSGRGNLTLNLSGQGKTTAALIGTLKGRIAANIANGAIIGADLGFQVRRALSLFQHQSSPVGSDQGQTKFDTFRVSADVAQGIASTKDLDIASRQLRVTGAGTANLATEAINYRLQVAVLQGATTASAAPAATGALLTVPVDVTGTLSDFKVRPDLAGLAKSNLQNLNKKQLEQKIPGLLKGLLGSH